MVWLIFPSFYRVPTFPWILLVCNQPYFLPKSILETRKDDLIELQIFLEDNRKYLIYANKELIRFDDELIGQINYIIEDTNYFFEVEGLSSSHNPYEKMLVVMLNKEEQKRLSIEKGFFSAWQH